MDRVGSRQCRLKLLRNPMWCEEHPQMAKNKCGRTCNRIKNCPCFDGPKDVVTGEVMNTLKCQSKLASWGSMCDRAAKNRWVAQCPFTCNTCKQGGSAAAHHVCEDAPNTDCAGKLASWGDMCLKAGGVWRNLCRKTCRVC